LLTNVCGFSLHRMNLGAMVVTLSTVEHILIKYSSESTRHVYSICKIRIYFDIIKGDIRWNTSKWNIAWT